MTAAERAEVFAETAARKGLPEAILEKDFWVCWVLQQLFAIQALSDRLLFKGGTSLSKIFHAINRFSEDIDLAVDYTALGFSAAESVDLYGRFCQIPPPPTWRTHRDSRSPEIGSSGFVANVCRSLNAPQRPSQPSQRDDLLFLSSLKTLLT
jgi:hypothetical protein